MSTAAPKFTQGYVELFSIHSSSEYAPPLAR